MPQRLDAGVPGLGGTGGGGAPLDPFGGLAVAPVADVALPQSHGSGRKSCEDTSP